MVRPTSVGTVGLSPRSALKLKPVLDAFLRTHVGLERIQFDPVELPHRYSDPRDVEVSALLSACLAYGRVDLFKPKLDALHRKMGRSPAAFVRELELDGAAELLDGFVYRFNVASDLAVLLLGMGRMLRERGSLEAAFVEHFQRTHSLREALSGFTAELHRERSPSLERRMGPVRGLAHLIPSPLGPGAAKRLNLFLRWMVRGPDPVDFGLWRQVSTASLLIPLDTHIGRISHHLGLTRRTDLSWRTAEEITASLRRLDPEDPVRYDFALCHWGMSGQCPAQVGVAHCQVCELRGACLQGAKVLGRRTRSQTASR